MFLTISGFFIGINFVTFILFGIDKYFALNQMWRISNRTLLSAAICGGSIGAVLGQKYFKHKTKSFSGIFPILILLQIIAATSYLIYLFNM